MQLVSKWLTALGILYHNHVVIQAINSSRYVIMVSIWATSGRERSIFLLDGIFESMHTLHAYITKT